MTKIKSQKQNRDKNPDDMRNYDDTNQLKAADRTSETFQLLLFVHSQRYYDTPHCPSCTPTQLFCVF